LIADRDSAHRLQIVRHRRELTVLETGDSELTTPSSRAQVILQPRKEPARPSIVAEVRWARSPCSIRPRG